MPFAYYERLSPARQRIYRASDAVGEVPLPRPELLRPLAAALERALTTGDPGAVGRVAQRLANGICDQLGVRRAAVTVLERRPHAHWGELHGLYEPARPPRHPRITVWMRTARRERVVAFRTFLRTLLHELLHHLDYTLLRLPDSLQTEGFYRRESSLFRQLVPETRAARDG